MEIVPASNTVVLGLGFLLGLRHAIDADHIVAVATFIGSEKQLRRACAIGVFWGVGHTLALLLAGIVVIAVKVPISQWLAAQLELVVAAMLVFLGARLIATNHQKWHAHHHSSEWKKPGLVRPVLVGVVHGTAGSAALTLMVLSTLTSPVEAILYILIFGIGSMAGMLVVSLILSLPVTLAQRRMNLTRPIQLAAGLLSCAFGIHLGLSVWNSMP